MDTLKEYEEVNEKFGDPEILEDPDKMDALINRQAELQDKIDATDAWNLDSRLERAMDALRCPPEDQVVDTLSGGERRRVALCRLLLQQPDILLLDDRPTTWMLSRSTGWNNIYNNIRVGYLHHTRPLLPRPCGRMDSGTGSRRRYSLERELLFLAGSKDQTYGTGGETSK